MLNTKEPIVFLDVETTGLSVTESKIIQFGALKILPVNENHVNGRQEELNLLINPLRHIPQEASAVHDITDEMVKNSLPFSAYAGNIHSFLNGCNLAGYNLRAFDLPILEFELDRCNYELPPYLSIIDLMQLVYKFNPRTLEASVRNYCPEFIFKTHDALEDARATSELLRAMLNRHKEISCFADLTRPELADLAGLIAFDENKQPVFNFGKFKGQPLLLNYDYCKWMINSDSFPLSTIKFIKTFLELNA